MRGETSATQRTRSLSTALEQGDNDAYDAPRSGGFCIDLGAMARASPPDATVVFVPADHAREMEEIGRRWKR